MPLHQSDHLSGRVAVFIDAANMIYCHKDLGWKIDFKKVKKYFEEKCQLIGMYYYSAYLVESIGQQSFFEMLSRKGFILRLKKLKRIAQSDGTFILKGNCDTDLVVDAVARMAEYDSAVIMSGDSDFVSLVHLLKDRQKKVVVISTRWHIAHDLIQAADFYCDLKKFRLHWERNVEKSEITKSPFGLSG